MRKNAYLDAKNGVDPAENEPPKEAAAPTAARWDGLFWAPLAGDAQVLLENYIANAWVPPSTAKYARLVEAAEAAAGAGIAAGHLSPQVS